jgi:hypothetical protein
MHYCICHMSYNGYYRKFRWCGCQNILWLLKLSGFNLHIPSITSHYFTSGNFYGKKYSAWSQYSWFYVYIFIYLSIHLAVLGPVLYQPVKDILGDITYNFSHKKEIALINDSPIDLADPMF